MSPVAPPPVTGPLPYRDASLAIETRARDLLARMTWEEKLAQIVGVWSTTLRPAESARFAYEKLSVTPDRIDPEGDVTICAEIVNEGPRAAEEVVQLYVHDEIASVTRPVMELRGFVRLALAPRDRAARTLHDAGEGRARGVRRRTSRRCLPSRAYWLAASSTRTPWGGSISISKLCIRRATVM